MNLAVLWLSFLKIYAYRLISVCLLCRNAKTAVSFYLSDCSLYLCTVRTCLILTHSQVAPLAECSGAVGARMVPALLVHHAHMTARTTLRSSFR